MRPVSKSTPPSRPQMSHPWVSLGSRGPSVAQLQRELQAAGISPGPIDGIFGAMTERAVRAYQEKFHLAVDGIVGPQTWGSLDRDGFKPGAAGNPAAQLPGDSFTPGPSSGVSGPVPKSGNAFIDSIAKGAMEAQQKYGVPASVTIAQAILESGWGKHDLNAHNLFGIKGTGPAGSVTVPTKEYVNGQWITIHAAFRAYHNAAESMEDHGRLLATSGYYTKAMSVRGDPRAFANALTGVYATAPNYGQSLISLMNQYNLYRFDR